MSQALTINLDDKTYDTLCQRAEASGMSAEQLAATSLEQFLDLSNGFSAQKKAMTEEEKQAARERFERHFGEIDLGGPTGTDNESIDADLAREYGNNHEDE